MKRTGLSKLTDEQFRIVYALVNKHAEIAHSVARLTPQLRAAIAAGDHTGFNLILAEIGGGCRRCEAAKIAIAVTLGVFLNDPMSESTSDATAASSTFPWAALSHVFTAPLDRTSALMPDKEV
jgi:hypothetical protein